MIWAKILNQWWCLEYELQLYLWMTLFLQQEIGNWVLKQLMMIYFIPFIGGELSKKVKYVSIIVLQ